MNPRDEIHGHLQACCDIVLAYVREHENECAGGLVPATAVNDGLNLNVSAAPKGSQQPTGQRGWLLATFARMLVEQEKLEHHKKGNRSYYKSR